MSFLRIGDSTVPVSLSISSSDIIPDCTLVTNARFRIFREANEGLGAADLTVDATISQSTANSYVASYTPTSMDTAYRDNLRIYVDSSVDSGLTWIPTSEAFELEVRAH